MPALGILLLTCAALVVLLLIYAVLVETRDYDSGRKAIRAQQKIETPAGETRLPR